MRGLPRLIGNLIPQIGQRPHNPEPVSVTYRTGLCHVETELGKWRAETGARNPLVLDRKCGNCGTETRAYQPNPPECRRFSHTRKSHRRDWTAWLGWEDSNS